MQVGDFLTKMWLLSAGSCMVVIWAQKFLTATLKCAFVMIPSDVLRVVSVFWLQDELDLFLQWNVTPQNIDLEWTPIQQRSTNSLMQLELTDQTHFSILHKYVNKHQQPSSGFKFCIPSCVCGWIPGILCLLQSYNKNKKIVFPSLLSFFILWCLTFSYRIMNTS